MTICEVLAPMSIDDTPEPPLLQRLYDNIWLLAAAGLLFFFLSYVLWGFVDIWAVQSWVIP